MGKVSINTLFFVIFSLVSVMSKAASAADMCKASNEKELSACQYALPQDVAAYLKGHQVPSYFNTQLDGLLSDTDMQKSISILYSGDRRESREMREKLEKKGWKFLKQYSNYIYSHPSFPGYIFKMPRYTDLDSELLNVGRIQYGHILRQQMKEHHVSCSVSPESAYFVPQSTTKKFLLPKVLVVAREVQGSNKFDAKQLEEIKN